MPDGATDPRSDTAARSAAPGRTELYWAPAAVAALLVLVELYAVLREFRGTLLMQRDV